MNVHLRRNVRWTAVSALTELALAFAIGIACARFMGSSAYGGLSAGVAISGVFKRLITGGLGPPAIREMGNAQSPEEAAAWEASAKLAILKNSVVWVPAALGCAWLLPKEIGLALAICSIALPASFIDARSWRLQALLEKRLEVVPDRAGQLAGGIARLALIALAAPGWLFAVGISVSDWTRTALLSRTTTNLPSGQAEREKEEWLKAASHKLLGGTLAKYILASAPLLILAGISTTAAGNYWAAARVAGLATLPIALYLPSANAEVLAGGNQANTHIWRVLLGSLAAGGTLAAIGPWVLAVLYGPSFAGAGPCASILSLGVTATGAGTLLEARLVAKRRERCVTQAAALSSIAGLGLALSLWFTGTAAPATAAAVAIASSQMLGALLCAFSLIWERPGR